MKIITAIKSWFFGEKPLATGENTSNEISAAACAEAEKPTTWAGSMGPLVGLQLASHPSRCAGFGPRASVRSLCSCLPLAHASGSWRGCPLLPLAPGSCARAARSPTPPAQKDCSLWQRQSLAARHGQYPCAKCTGLGLGNAPVCPAKQCTEPSPGTALLSARVDFFA